MDLQFEVTVGQIFTMEVGFFDTVLEIKEKVEKYQKIPVSKQTLVFGDNVLQDDLNVHFSEILDHSLIKLLVARTDNNGDNHDISDEKSQLSSSTPPTSNKIKLLVRIILSSSIFKLLELEMEVTDTIKKLREKLLVHQEREVIGGGGPVSLLIKKPNGNVELQDQSTLDECQLGDGSEIEVTVVKRPIKTSSPTIATTCSPTVAGPPVVKRPIMASSLKATATASLGTVVGSRKSKITVLSNCGKKVPVEVNLWDKVRTVRKELEKVNEQMNLDLEVLRDHYFFIFKQNVMDDNRSFRWHRVQPGDTIEAFYGTVTLGT